MSSGLPPATQPPPIKTNIGGGAGGASSANAAEGSISSGIDGASSSKDELNAMSPTPLSPESSAGVISANNHEISDLAAQTEKLSTGTGTPAVGTTSGSGATGATGPTVVSQSSEHLLEDPKLQEIMLSDVGSNALLSRLKQSVISCREFATFIKKKAQLESEHQQSMKKLSRSTRETIKKPDGRQGTFVSQFDEIVRSNERVCDVGSTFVAALHTMNDELSELARHCDKSRKAIKERCLREEKNLSDAEQMADKARAKYDSHAEDFERMRTGDPTKNRFGFKQSKTVQHEEELHKKVIAAEADYKQRVDQAQRLRNELVNKLRPVSIRELKNLILECDSGVSLQLAKYANLNEVLALNSGFIVSPLKPAGSSTSPLTMKEVAAKVDNELDFYNYVMAIPKSRKLNRPVITYKQHPAMASAYPSSAPSIQPKMSGTLQPTMSGPKPPATQQPRVASTPINHHQPQPPQQHSIAPTQSPPQPSQDRSASGPAGLSPSSTINTAPTVTSTTLSQPIQYPPGTISSMPVFGSNLEELLDYEEGTVPRVVFQCTQAVDAFGLEVEGIYRHNGNNQQTQQIRRLFDTDSANIDLLQPSANLNDIHSVASALKQYFRELPDPLMTSEFHEEFLQAAKIENETQRRDAIHATINKLPDANYSTLRYLVFHLYRVQEREAINRMSIDNLGIVWGPTLFGADHNDVEGITTQGRIVSIILYNAYTIFDAD